MEHTGRRARAIAEIEGARIGHASVAVSFRIEPCGRGALMSYSGVPSASGDTSSRPRSATRQLRQHKVAQPCKGDTPGLGLRVAAHSSDGMGVGGLAAGGGIDSGRPSIYRRPSTRQ
jgi:hypothetical protein